MAIIPEIILAGRWLNDNMEKYIASEVVKLMISRDHKIKGANVLILGITFKENCPDIRNTRVVDVFHELKQYGITAASCHLYGIGDNYHPQNSHVIPALIRRVHEAKINDAPEVTILGTGTPRREFLYIDDMAETCVHVMNLDQETYNAVTTPMQSHSNVGSGEDITIKELAHRKGYRLRGRH